MTQRRQIIPPEQIHSFKNTTGGTLLRGQVVIPHTVEGEMKLPAGDATDHLLLVLLHDVVNGAYADCACGPAVLPVLASGALATPSTKLMVNNAGKAAAWAAGGGANRAVLGTQLTPAAALDELIEVLVAGPDTVHQG